MKSAVYEERLGTRDIIHLTQFALQAGAKDGVYPIYLETQTDTITTQTLALSSVRTRNNNHTIAFH